MQPNITWHTNDAEQTVWLAKSIGKHLKSGDIICLEGDLGAGKTTFARGIVNAFGKVNYVTSPTFTIVNEYDGIMPVYHFDIYRIEDSDELFEMGFFEYFERRGIILIEWASKHLDALPSNRFTITLQKDTCNLDGRIITMSAPDGMSDRIEGLRLQLKESN
ncbi:MAG: tRNA (adenosine(37)-N6)-threonylcarbamoyltransferase complex ATPase subunit type 1 TsaE [Hyphomonadaceae bacterium]|nr:tRNA (adenosine(37)-N6)-threonylcarbamoyltransferase complex ATPase subunit type 1 TsaE [Clostridia bacterium]